MTHYEVNYFAAAAFGDLPRMLLEVAGAKYENTFVDREQWTTTKERMAFGKVPRLVVHAADGSKKELFESFAMVAYLAEVLGLVPGAGSAFERAEALSVVSALLDLEDTIRAAGSASSADERKSAHEALWTGAIPRYLKFHERFVRGQYYFGDKVTVADLKLYQVSLRLEEMYGASNPFRTLELPKLNGIIAALDKGKAGDYARNRRTIGKFMWLKEEWKWGMGA